MKTMKDVEKSENFKSLQIYAW